MATPPGMPPMDLHQIPAAEPPPGVIPNLINPPNHTRGLITQHAVCLTLVTIAVAVRLFTRTVITRSIGWDDYTALFAWAMIVAFSGLVLAAIPYGYGRHVYDVPADEIVMQLKLGFVAEIMYLPISLAIKTAFLLFFGRIFAVNNNITVKWLIRGGIAANVMFYTAFFFDTVFLCSPVKLAYNPAIPGHCQDEQIAPYITGVWGFCTDIFVLILPLTCIWKLQVKRNKKSRLTFVFSVGLFACIASVIRFAYTVKLVNDPDVSWNFATLSLWSVFEIHIGLICACLPAFLPFYEHTFRNGFSIQSSFSRFSSFIKRRTTRSSSSNERPSSNPPSHPHQTFPKHQQHPFQKVSSSTTRSGDSRAPFPIIHHSPPAVPPSKRDHTNTIMVNHDYNVVVSEGDYARRNGSSDAGAGAVPAYEFRDGGDHQRLTGPGPGGAGHRNRNMDDEIEMGMGGGKGRGAYAMQRF